MATVFGKVLMPTYSYLCKDCGHAFDIHQDFSDAALTECPECQGALRKKFGNVGIAFKGSGFYRTDSREAGNGSQKSSRGAAGESADTSGASGSSSDSGSSSSDSDKGASSGNTGSSARNSAGNGTDPN